MVTILIEPAERIGTTGYLGRRNHTVAVGVKRRWSAKVPSDPVRAGLVAFRNVRSWARSMSSPVSFLAVVHCLRTLPLVAVDLIRLGTLAARPRPALVAENLFLRKQLALFQERKVESMVRSALLALEVEDGGPNAPTDNLCIWSR